MFTVLRPVGTMRGIFWTDSRRPHHFTPGQGPSRCVNTVVAASTASLGAPGMKLIHTGVASPVEAFVSAMLYSTTVLLHSTVETHSDGRRLFNSSNSFGWSSLMSSTTSMVQDGDTVLAGLLHVNQVDSWLHHLHIGVTLFADTVAALEIFLRINSAWPNERDVETLAYPLDQ